MMQEESPEDRTIHGLLFPEILSRDELCDILQQRCMLTNLERKEAGTQQLIDRFREFIQPRPQRLFSSDSEMGRIISKHQPHRRKRVSFPPAMSSMAPPKRLRTGSDNLVSKEAKQGFQERDTGVTSQLLTSRQVKDPAAPPAATIPSSCIDFSKRTIKLGGGAAASTPSSRAASANTNGPAKPLPSLHLKNKPEAESGVLSPKKVSSSTSSVVSAKRPPSPDPTKSSSPKKFKPISIQWP